MAQHNRGTLNDLATYRLSTAEEDIKDAKTLFSTGSYRASNNRAYYSVFHAINAVHILNGESYKKHKDAISNFNKEYVKTEIFPRSIGRRIARAEEIRHASDYDDFYIVTKGYCTDASLTHAVKLCAKNDIVRNFSPMHRRCIF